MNVIHRWANVFKQTQKDCRVNDYLLKDKVKFSSKDLTGSQIYRKFSEYIKRPMIRAAAEVLKHIDKSTGIPPSGTTWKDVLVIIQEWWRREETARKELDKRRRATKAYNKTQAVLDGITLPQNVPQVLPTSWVCPPLRANKSFEDPFMILIPRFVPRLCEGLGFPPSPTCFSGKSPKVEKFTIKRKSDGRFSDTRSTSRCMSRKRETQKKRKYLTESEASSSYM